MLEESNCKLNKKSVPPRKSAFGRPDFKERHNSALCATQKQRFPQTSRRSGNASPSTLVAEQSLTASKKSSDLNLANFKLKWALKKITRKLHALVIPKQNNTGFVEEEWVSKTTEEFKEEEEQPEWLLRTCDWPNRLIHPVLALVYMAMCWQISVDIAFDVDNNSKIVSVWIVALLVDIILSLNTVRLRGGLSLRTRCSIFKDYIAKESYADFVIMIYAVLQHLQTDCYTKIAFHVITLLVLLKKLCCKNQVIRTYDSCRGIIDSVLLLLAASHFAVLNTIIQALILFLSSKFAPQRSWLQHIGIENSKWQIQYIYSLYWAVTTIVTVGYGDITPQNEHEVVVTMIIQLAGSALFGYLINVIGSTMSEMKYFCGEFRKAKENLHEELGIADRLVKCLNLKDDLSYELKSFLKDNQKSNQYFSIKEEKRIWDKLKPDLKYRTFLHYLGLLEDTNIRVMKKCIFFLTYFSRNLQNSIAMKLEKRVFQPNERIGMDDDTHSFFIIDQGKADLQYGRIHMHKPLFKTLRTINKDGSANKRNVSSNLFGFTAVLLHKRTNLTALSKQFIVTYELKLKDFDELVAQYPADFETVCQLRDNILSATHPESYQGPELVDPRTHFIPIKHLTIRRHDINRPQPRKEISRQRCRSIRNRFDLQGDEMSGSQITGMINYNSQNVNATISSRASGDRNATDSILQFVEVPASRVVLEQFDQAKNYSKYFLHANIDKVLAKFNPSEKQPASNRRRKRSPKSATYAFWDTVQ